MPLNIKAAPGRREGLDDLDVLLEFYNVPAEHWVDPRMTNPIESTFATVRHLTRVTEGPDSRAAGLAMALKLIQAAQARWRAVNPPHLVALSVPERRSTTANSSNGSSTKPMRRSLEKIFFRMC